MSPLFPSSFLLLLLLLPFDDQLLTEVEMMMMMMEEEEVLALFRLFPDSVYREAIAWLLEVRHEIV